MTKRNSRKRYCDVYFHSIMKIRQDLRLGMAIREFRKYLGNYPNDQAAYFYYADTLIRVNQLEEAEQILSNIVISDKRNGVKQELLALTKLKLLCCQGRYQEAFFLLQKNMKLFEEQNIDIMSTLLFIRKKLNLLERQHEFSDSYLFQQIMNYQESVALDHIKEHLPYDDSQQFSQFTIHFPITDIYYELRDRLPIDHLKINHDMMSNMYVFRWNRSGKLYGKLVNYIKVITLQNSNDIITICPYDNKVRLPYYDLSSLVQQDSYSKVKRVSQLDKFYQRYGKIVDKK